MRLLTSTDSRRARTPAQNSSRPSTSTRSARTGSSTRTGTTSSSRRTCVALRHLFVAPLVLPAAGGAPVQPRAKRRAGLSTRWPRSPLASTPLGFAAGGSGRQVAGGRHRRRGARGEDEEARRGGEQARQGASAMAGKGGAALRRFFRDAAAAVRRATNLSATLSVPRSPSRTRRRLRSRGISRRSSSRCLPQPPLLARAFPPASSRAAQRECDPARLSARCLCRRERLC